MTFEGFALRDVGHTLDGLETPIPVIDLDVVERNLRRWQRRCDELGLASRPHIKTHKLVGLARAQLNLGAKGITVQKLGEAEVMAKGGISDMLLTFNVVGRTKLERLATLMQTTSIMVVADNQEMLEGLSAAAASSGRKLKVLVECDTGMGRNGVQTPPDALKIAQSINRQPGLACAGLMTYPATGMRITAKSFLDEARHLMAKSGLDTAITSSGGTPDMWTDEGLEGLAEYRAGTYIYFDRSLVARNTCQFEDCALKVLSTVVSRPTADRAMLDAGTKSLTSDLLGLEGYGVVHELGDARIYNASEEHGFLDLRDVSAKPVVGDRVMITPNHVCPVSNLFDEVVLMRGQSVIGAVKVDARGCVH